MKKATLRDLAFLAICVALSLVVKRIISPVTNGLTDFFRIPGGSTAAGFSLAFLIIGKRIAPFPFAATVMSLVQALLALALFVRALPFAAAEAPAFRDAHTVLREMTDSLSNGEIAR